MSALPCALCLRRHPVIGECFSNLLSFFVCDVGCDVHGAVQLALLDEDTVRQPSARNCWVSVSSRSHLTASKTSFADLSQRTAADTPKPFSKPSNSEHPCHISTAFQKPSRGTRADRGVEESRAAHTAGCYELGPGRGSTGNHRPTRRCFHAPG